MSRTTELSTVQRTVTNKTFSAKAVPYQQLDEDAQIKKALEMDKVEVKERELLERELEKPFSQRNKALMNKYRGRMKEVLNGYPSDVSRGGYSIIATARDDPNVTMGQRPQPWYAIAEYENAGNKWRFKFPIQKEAAGDGAEIYKLDFFNTWVYRDSSPVDSMGEDEVTPYIVLYRLIRGNPTLAQEYLKDGVYDFNFPGFYVEYTRDSTKDSLKEPVEKKVEEPNKQQFVWDPEWITPIEGTEDAALDFVKKTDAVAVGAVPLLPKTSVKVDAVGIGRSESPYTWLYYDAIEDEHIYAILLNGSGVATRFLKAKTLKIPQITAQIEKHNLGIVKKFNQK